jgi:hypothetical protein
MPIMNGYEACKNIVYLYNNNKNSNDKIFEKFEIIGKKIS